MPPKCLKELKLASTVVDLHGKTLFLLSLKNLHQFSPKIAISDRECSFRQLIFQLSAAFCLFVTFFSHVFLEKSAFQYFKLFLRSQIQFSRHKFSIYRSRFEFQDMNAQSTMVDLISNSFMSHLRMNCEKERLIIYKLILVQEPK